MYVIGVYRENSCIVRLDRLVSSTVRRLIKNEGKTHTGTNQRSEGPPNRLKRVRVNYYSVTE